LAANRVLDAATDWGFFGTARTAAAKTVVTGRGNRPNVALRCASDRVQKAEQNADALSRRWQEAVRESEAVRGKLSAIENSDEYRALQWFGLHLGQPGSLRRRSFFACFRGLRRLCRELGACAESLRVVRPNRSDSGGQEQPNAAGPVRSQLTASGASQEAEETRSTPKTPQELTYHPQCWRLHELTADEQSLDLFVLSPVHRTGSTLLQRICNSRKETLLWGEHGGVLTHFATIFRSVALFAVTRESERDEYFTQGENPNLWIANMCPELECVQQAIVNSARSLLSTLYGRYRKTHDILGFKEVQYGRAELGLLRCCYPKAQFLLLLRNPLNAWKSTPRNWYPSLEHWTKKYNDGVSGYLDFAANDANCHVLRYEDLIKLESKVMAVLADVARLSPETVAMVLAHKIGSSSGLLSDSDRDLILATCREPMERLGYRVAANG
jgi:hypothetical protein